MADGLGVGDGVGVDTAQGAGQATSSYVRLMGVKNEYGVPNIGVTERESSAENVLSTVITFVLVWKHENAFDDGSLVQIAFGLALVQYCGATNCIQAPPAVRSVAMTEPW